MNAKLGNTIQFSYSAEGIHDKKPQIFFLAKVGNLVHGLNQHYQSPQEKLYYFLTLNHFYFDKIRTGKIDAYDFYHKYIKKHFVTDSYRTYKTKYISSPEIIKPEDTSISRGIDKRLTPIYKRFHKGDKIKYIRMLRGKLEWVDGEVIGRNIPKTGRIEGANWAVKTKEGKIIYRHPMDIRKR